MNEIANIREKTIWYANRSFLFTTFHSATYTHDQWKMCEILPKQNNSVFIWPVLRYLLLQVHKNVNRIYWTLKRWGAKETKYIQPQRNAYIRYVCCALDASYETLSQVVFLNWRRTNGGELNAKKRKRSWIDKNQGRSLENHSQAEFSFIKILLAGIGSRNDFYTWVNRRNFPRSCFENTCYSIETCPTATFSAQLLFSR